jgi:AcrR family transcriptional regulator
MSLRRSDDDYLQCHCMSTPPAVVDGRTARSLRTRHSIVDALLGLVEDGEQPSVPAIAKRAGVSSRAVHVHFRTVNDLHAALVERVTGLVIERLAVIDPAEPLDARIDLLCGQRARINEDLGTVLQAADGYERTSPAIAAGRDFGRQASRAQLQRVFAAELAARPPGTAQRIVAAVDALLTHSSWHLLRTTHGLSPDEARLALRDGVRALLIG